MLEFSPNGEVIVFQSKSNDPLGDIGYADISDLKKAYDTVNDAEDIERPGAVDTSPAFSSDGKSAYFSTRKLGQTTKYIVRYDFDSDETQEFPSIGCDEIEVIALDKILCTYQSRLYVWNTKADEKIKVIGDDSFKISQASIDTSSGYIYVQVRNFDQNGNGRIDLDDPSDVWRFRLGDKNDITVFEPYIYVGDRIASIAAESGNIFVSKSTGKFFDLFRISNASVIPESRLSMSNATQMIYIESAKLFAAQSNN